MLYGEYNHNLDSKGRMNFPAKMREELGPSFVVTLWMGNCLAAFSEEEWNRICDRIREMPMSQSLDLVRYMFSNACSVEPDKQGRILIPQNLRDAVGLGKDVTVIGAMSRAEIWDTAVWQERKKAMDNATFVQKMTELRV